MVMLFQTESATEQQESKKRKLSASHHMTPLVTISDTNHSAANTVMSFTTAVRCWELLHGNDCLRKDFTRICQIWKTDNWHWLQTFQVELLMYEGMYTEAIQKLQQDESTTWSIRCNLQKASCYYMLNNYVQCSSCTAEILQTLNSTQEQQQQVQRSNRSQTTNMLSQPGPRRHLHLLITSRQNVLDYCVLLLTTCLKKRLYGSSTCGQQSDALLSSTLVMLQWNWPMEADTFIYIIDCIVQRACFTYKLFLNYVTNVDVLEEFAFLWKHHPNVVIDLLPISQAEIASKRALTRGVKQNASEDFKQAMIKQVASPCRDIEKLVQMFIISELETLQRALM
ncbi:PREDICTED: integrator complex subunit 10-like [Priapulus caudatus]|uniref:Integrator complex subunit 10 n=1 Tax=Priapulus caudatus TaxID=37621 RepID=A0ABM1F8K1_PRICU|nr:PREDICTED: integrator complex subunit 10-like [Priapulus caudatus]